MFAIIYKCFLVLFSFCQLASCAKYRCFKTPTDYIEVAVDQSEQLYSQCTVDYFDINKETYLFAPGHKFRPDGRIPTAIIKSLLDLPGDRNVVLVDWSEEANCVGDFPDLPKIKSVGEAVGKGMATLASWGMKRDIHFIGYDFGAHLAGYAGRQAIHDGLWFDEIVALDPTTYGFGDKSHYKPVDKTCATFVSVVHCDPTGYSFNKPLGHVDFWPNYGNYDSPNSIRRQPGCPEHKTKSDNEKLFNGDDCSHDRCWQLYNLSLKDASRFLAGKANNYKEWVAKNGNFNSKDTTYVGPKINSKARGNFYFSTSAKSPFGLGKDGLKSPKCYC